MFGKKNRCKLLNSNFYNKCTLFLFILICQFSYTQSIIDIPKINSTITLNGDLNELEWKNSYTLEKFKQITPDLGAVTTEKAIVKVLYDDQYLYIGGISYFSNPSQMFATTLERDINQVKDDYIEFHIDTYNDKINTLVFRINPLGTRQDFEISRNGEVFNTSWNTFWDGKSKVNTDSWTTEIRIPFSSLRYKKASENIMRIKVIINYKEKNELIISPLNNIDISSIPYHFTNSQEVRFKGLPSTKPLYITPYIKSTVIQQNILNKEGTAYQSETTFLERKNYINNNFLDKIVSNIGLDIKYKPTANQTLNFTLNTDFAEVEADDRIINISRFPIFLPEKRLFFLENSDLFNSNMFDHRLFNSRRIGLENGQTVPIIGGLRFTGSSANWQYGLLSMQTHKVDGLAISNNMSVARVRKTIGKLGSNIGLINTNKVNSENSNHLIALDANIRFSNIIKTRFTTGITFDKQTGSFKPMYGFEINTFSSNGFGINYRFREYTEDFNPKLGFLSRPNTKRLTINNGWRKTYTNPKFLSFLSLGSWFTRYWIASTNQKEFLQTNFYLTAIHKNGARLSVFFPMYQEDNLFQDWQISEGIKIPANNYVMWKVGPFFETGKTKPYQGSIEVEAGEFYGGNQFTINYNFSYDFNKYFRAEIGGTFNQLSFPKSYAVNTSRKLNLSRYFAKLKFNFSSKSALNTFLQYDTKADKLGLNLRFRYNPTEGTDLYVVYNHNVNTSRSLLSPRLPSTDNQIFIIKYSKTILK